jgi:hypothetical protein
MAKMDDLTPAQKSFLSKRIAAGDRLTQDRMQHYLQAHHKAVADGHEVDSRKYFDAVGTHADTLGGSRKAATDQPKPIRYDGASSPMPKLRGGGDEFKTLRKAANANGRYGARK